MRYFLATDKGRWFLLPEVLRGVWDRIGNHLYRHQCDLGRIIEDCKVDCDVSEITFEGPDGPDMEEQLINNELNFGDYSEVSEKL